MKNQSAAHPHKSNIHTKLIIRIKVNCDGHKRQQLKYQESLTLLIIDFRKDSRLIVKVRKLLFGQDVGSDHL